MSWLITILRDVPDPRRGNARRHDLLDVLTIALVASICGCESCVEFADFGEDREELFREFLGLENGLPSHDTFSRLFRLIDPEALSAAFGRFLDVLGEDGAGVVAIDGKTLRRSFDRVAGQSALHVVTAFAADARCQRRRQTSPHGGARVGQVSASFYPRIASLFGLREPLLRPDLRSPQPSRAAAVKEARRAPRSGAQRPGRPRARRHPHRSRTTRQLSRQTIVTSRPPATGNAVVRRLGADLAAIAVRF